MRNGSGAGHGACELAVRHHAVFGAAARRFGRRPRRPRRRSISRLFVPSFLNKTRSTRRHAAPSSGFGAHRWNDRRRRSTRDSIRISERRSDGRRGRRDVHGDQRHDQRAASACRVSTATHRDHRALERPRHRRGDGMDRELARLDKQEPSFDLTLTADTIHAFNRRTIADVYFSTPRAAASRRHARRAPCSRARSPSIAARSSRPIRISRASSPSRRSTENGGTRTDNEHDVHRSDERTRDSGVPVTLGEDVRLRSSEADVRLTRPAGAREVEHVDADDRARAVSSCPD